jgi:hypothetical protein
MAVKNGMNDSDILTAVYSQISANITVDSANITNLVALLNAASGGANYAPIGIAVTLDLSEANWINILSALQSAGKYVNLNLSACTAGNSATDSGLYSNGTFAPYVNPIRGRKAHRRI